MTTTTTSCGLWAALPLRHHPAACRRAPLQHWSHSPAASARRPRSRQLRRLHFMAAAGGDAPGGEGGEADIGPSSVEAAFQVAQSLMELFQTRQHDALIQHLPEAVIDRLLERKASRQREQAGLPITAVQQPDETGQSLSFEELLALAQPPDLELDSYSARGVLLAVPRSATVLSSLRLAPTLFRQRYEVTTQSGEEMVLTFELQLEEALEPKYRGLQLVHKWFLKAIKGEPACPGELPLKPEPRWGPETIVQAQLAALQRGDAAGVFCFASPRNQQMPQYRPLLHHESADLLRCVHMKPDVAIVIVGVRSNIPTGEPGVTQRVVYSWTVRLQGQAASGGCADCWMTDSVSPISQNLFTA
ncbi:hypothetical protein ACK3TF_002860 [Chlorella vulgaris]